MVDQKMDVFSMGPIELELKNISSASSQQFSQWSSNEFNSVQLIEQDLNQQYKFVDESDCLQPSFERNGTHDLSFLLPTTDQLEVSYCPSSDDEVSELKNRIYAHKSKVSAKSDYFRLLLTNGMKESSQQEIIIPNVSVDIFFEILIFLYTSELSVNQYNLNQIFLVCDQFLLEDGKQVCRDFIKQIEPEVLEMLLLEDDNLSTELTELYVEYAIEHANYFLSFERVSKLSKDILIRVLNNSDITIKEIEIFKSVLEWIKVNQQQESKSVVSELFHLIRFPLMDYQDMIDVVEPCPLVPVSLIIEAYRHLSKPKMLPLSEKDLQNQRLNPRKKISLSPGVDVFSLKCSEHKNCQSVSWPINNFSAIQGQKHVSNTFEMCGLTWKMWAYPAGEAKHIDSFSVYLEAVRVKERESYDFLRNTTFFFGLVNQKNKLLCRQYPSSPNVLFNNEKSVWGNGLVELKYLYDKSLGYLDNDCVTVQLHILECIALDGHAKEV